MQNGLERFETHIQAIKEAIIKINKKDHIFDGDVIYELRSALFMTQGLARLYVQMYKQTKLFTQIIKHCKKLEDAIGAVDHFHCLTEDLATLNYPSSIIVHYNEELIKAEKKLYKLYFKKGWSTLKKTDKWSNKLLKFEWHSSEEDLHILKDVYQSEIKEVEEFLNGLDDPLSEMEHEVHELRRKLRWLSIYAQCTKGAFKTTNNSTRKKYLETYHSPDIVSSPFTKINTSKSSEHTIVLSHPDFIALSWTIKQLGDIKDKGLVFYETIEYLKSIPQKKNNKNGELPLIRSKAHKGLDLALYEAEYIIKIFKSDKVLEHLMF